MPANRSTIRMMDSLPELPESGNEGGDVKRRRGRGGVLASFSLERGMQLVAGLRRGMALKDACKFANIKQYDVKVWLNAARKEDASEELRRFYDEFRSAPASLEYALLGYVLGAAVSGSWQAAAWMLERLWPERYAKVLRREGYDSGMRPLHVILDVGQIDGPRLYALEALSDGEGVDTVVGDGDGEDSE